MTSIESAFAEIHRSAAQRMEAVNMPGLAIAVTDREKLLHLAAFGYADLSSGKPIEPGVMFEIGSIGKSFTNIALMQLHEEGKLDLREPVSRYLPWFEAQSDYDPITTHHLMSHTSGLPAGTDIGTHGLYEAWALRHLRTGAPPGDYFRYSNVGYKALGFLLEEIDGRPYADSIQARVLDPLEMGNSHPVIGYETRRRAAVGYRSFYDDRPEHRDHGLVPALWTEYGVGDGCQASTAGDMGVYLRMLMNRGAGPAGRVLSEESFRLMTQRVIATPQWGGAWYGYGLIMAEVDGHAYLGHGGSTTGFMSGMVADMDDGIGVVVLVNGYSQFYNAVGMAMDALTVLRAGMQGQDIPPAPPVPNPESVSNAADYAGSYGAGQERLNLVARDGRLTLRWGDREVALQQRGHDSFYVPHPDWERFLLEFGREGGRVVEAFHGPRWYPGDGYSGPTTFRVSRGVGRVHRPLPHLQFRPDKLSHRAAKRRSAAALPVGRPRRPDSAGRRLVPRRRHPSLAGNTPVRFDSVGPGVAGRLLRLSLLPHLYAMSNLRGSRPVRSLGRAGKPQISFP